MSTQEEVTQPARIEIETSDGMALRQLVPEDAQAYFDLIEYDRQHLSQEHFGGRDETAEKYRTVEDVRHSIINPENPDKLRFGVWVDGVLIGSNNLTPSTSEQNKIESGSWIGKKYAGHGYGTRAKDLLADLAFNRLGYDAIFAHVFVGNEASKRSLLKAGYKFKKIFSEYRDGETVWLWLFELENADAPHHTKNSMSNT